MAINTNIFCLVEENAQGTLIIITDPTALPYYWGGMHNFNLLTNEEVAQYGWLLVVAPAINHETHYYGIPIIDVVAKTVTYPVHEKTLEEIEQYHVMVADRKMRSLWQAAYGYETEQISGSAVGMLTALVLNGNLKGMAVQMWIKGIWDDYYTRKAQIQADWTANPNQSFLTHGTMPHSVPELMVEYQNLISPPP